MCHQPLDLVNVLCEAPALLAMLSSRDWAALSSCGTQLRHLIHSITTIVMVDNVTSAAVVVEGSWPQLALIKVPVYRLSNLSLPPDSNFKVVASFCCVKEKSSALVVRPKAQHHQHQNIATAFRHLQNWRAGGSGVTVFCEDQDVLTQMTHWDWPCVTQLYLSFSRLGYASANQLVKGSWPALEHLCVSNTQLEEAALSVLLQFRWAPLTSLHLSSNPSLGTNAIALIPKAANLGADANAHIPEAATWKCLSMLSLTGIKLDSSCIHSIVLLHNQFQVLNLACTDTDAAAVSQLAAHPWPCLLGLDLRGNGLTADAVAHLVLAEIPDLQDLNLVNNSLGTVAAKHLVRSAWVKLRRLGLANNVFDNTAMAFLAKGNWPNLRFLSLYGNEVCDLGFELLMAGQWPELNLVMLDSNAFNEASCVLFDFHTPVPGAGVNSFFAASRALSSIPLERWVVWPNLTQVQFFPGHLVNKQEYISNKRSFWLELMSWSTFAACACVTIWLFKPKHGGN